MTAAAKQRIDYYTAGDYRCAVRVWEAKDPIADVLLIHGIISHSGWYGVSCQRLAEQGFNVHALDRRGSGLNFLDRGDIDHWKTWFDDVNHYMDLLSSQRPRLMLGVSWGGKFVAAYARRFPDSVCGIGLLCPGIYSQRFPGPITCSALSLASAVGLQTKRVTIPLQDAALFTNTPEHRDYIRDDPFTLRKVTIRFALEDQKLTRYARQAPEDIQIPTLMVLAEGDRVVDNSRLRSFFESLGTNDKNLIEFVNAAHTLEFEPDPSRYINNLCGWAKHAISKP